MNEEPTEKQKACKRVCEYEKRKRATDPEWYKQKQDRATKWQAEKYRTDPEYRKKKQERTKMYYLKKKEREQQAKDAAISQHSP